MHNRQKYGAAMLSGLFTALIITLLGVSVILASSLTVRNYGTGWFIGLGAGALVFWACLFLFFTRKQRRRRKISRQSFPQDWETILSSQVAYYSALTEQEKVRFRQEVQIFLGEKSLIPIETGLDEKTRVLVAASAIIPIFSFPDWEYDNLSEVLIYPADFDLEYNFNSKRADIMGLVTGRGSTMILSRQALIEGFRIDNDKQNVGFHEFVHKIDGLDGYIDGIPAVLTDKKLVARWLELIRSESEKIKKGHSDINPYALTNNAEFFAVASEYFFENPEAMSKKHPELYNILQTIYRQDLKSRFKAMVKSMFLPYGRKLGRNSPCPCGSGKKYKYCCLEKKIF